MPAGGELMTAVKPKKNHPWGMRQGKAKGK
jgi:hypothetical protein